MAASTSDGGKQQWRLHFSAELAEDALREVLEPALRAVPEAIARRLGPLSAEIVAELADPSTASEWCWDGDTLRVSVAAAEMDPHEVALELLTCLGQALWDLLSDKEVEDYLRQIGREILTGVEGEMDEAALRAKKSLVSIAFLARSRRRILHYARASFAATAAEYVHALWHDVTIRRGKRYLPAGSVRARLRLLESFFPPDPGYRLFPEARLFPTGRRGAAGRRSRGGILPGRQC